MNIREYQDDAQSAALVDATVDCLFRLFTECQFGQSDKLISALQACRITQTAGDHHAKRIAFNDLREAVIEAIPTQTVNRIRAELHAKAMHPEFFTGKPTA